MLTLSKDELYSIFTKLSISDLLSIGETCKYFNELINRPEYWYYLLRRDYPGLLNIVIMDRKEKYKTIYGLMYVKKIFKLYHHIHELYNTEGIYVGYYDIIVAPRSIGCLRNLTELYLNSNYLYSLPHEIGNLINLEWLDVKDNKLTEVPSTIGKLVKLVRLYLNNNNLISLPIEIGNLNKLERLFLGNNCLVSLPYTISNLSSLVELDISYNPNIDLENINLPDNIEEVYYTLL